MKKLAMLSVRALIQLIPEKFRQKLKKNEYLTTLYVKSVRKSGLFFDAPTSKQTQALYEDWLEINASTILPNDIKPSCWQAVIFGADSLKKTESNIRALGCRRCIFVRPSDADYSNHAISLLDDSLPTLMIKGGDTIESSTVGLLLEALKSSHLVYSDTDIIEGDGVRKKPRFLPNWNPELMYSTAYINSGVMSKTWLLKTIQICSNTTVAGIIAELSFLHRKLQISHIPSPLLHEPSDDDRFDALVGVKKVIEKYTETRVELDKSICVNRLCWANNNPLVSLIIPTKNRKELVKACIESILEKTTYRNYEILLIDNGSDEKESLDYFEYLNILNNVSVLKYSAPFNYSAINNFGVAHAKGSVIGLINNDIEVITPDWLTYLVGHVEREDVGCVGAKLLYSDTRIQHAGVVLGYGGGAGHAHKNFPRNHRGYLNRIIATSNFSAVTAACLLVKRTHFDAVGGLNEKDLSVAFNDVDFCLKVARLGVRNVYCAEAELYHHESVSRGLDVTPEKAARFNRELSYLQSTWDPLIKHDPAYNPNLTLRRENFSIKSKTEFDS